MPTGNDLKIMKSICSLCMKCCGVDAHVKDGKLVKVSGMREHPFNNLCVKARATADWLYSKERSTHPLRKTHGGWEQISWDEANANILADDEDRDPVSAYPGFKSVICRISKAE